MDIFIYQDTQDDLEDEFQQGGGNVFSIVNLGVGGNVDQYRDDDDKDKNKMTPSQQKMLW